VVEEQIIITSTRNRHIVEARKLEQRKHRQRQNQFLVEGAALLDMAIDAGARPVRVFYCEELLSSPQIRALLARFRQRETQVLAVSAGVMATLCEREAIEGVVATFELLETSLGDLTLPEPALVLVLDRLQDPGNVGTLIRTADAVGAAAVVLIEPCADPFDRKTVRGSMGSLFNVPIVRTNDPGVFTHLGEMGLRIVGTDVRTGILWGKGILNGSVALILGNEARGQSEDVATYVEANVTLPIPGKAESLNVAVAGGVLMYGWLRENQSKTRNVKRHPPMMAHIHDT
jgi:TrmH family RNA methyltransferase